jgi:hypothetical protein
MTNKTIASFRSTIAALKLALSLMPITRMTVTSAVTTRAGESSSVPVVTHFPSVASKSKGARLSASGSLSPNIPIRSWKYADAP